jgi:hypothetical protein
MPEPEIPEVAVEVPEILLPAAGIDRQRWAVIACDQYTSQRSYWEAIRARVGGAPSALHLVFPEAYLGDGDEAARIAAIHARMREYLENGVLGPPQRALVCVERETARGTRRTGLLVALDLEHYDHRAGARSLARASEQTVEERLPARVRVRDGAPLELPHAMVLIDDPGCTVIEPLACRTPQLRLLYDTPLMGGAGRLRGWAVERPGDLGRVRAALAHLAQPTSFARRYGTDGGADVLLYAVGDGNHSLAAARLIWERTRERLSEAQARAHPARFALVELVNVHAAGLVFEPIHRVVFGVDPLDLLGALPGWLTEQGARCRVEPRDLRDAAAPRADPAATDQTIQTIGYVADGLAGVIAIERPPASLAAGSLQRFLDVYVGKHPEASVDYIHGDEVVRSLAAGPRRIGFYLPALDKQRLFATLIREGPLPRKAFSLGRAEDKRFYMEARRITPD